MKIQILEKNILFIPTESSVAVQRDESGSWMYGTIAGHGPEDHDG